MDNSKEYIVAAAYMVNKDNAFTREKLIYKNKNLWKNDVPSYDDIYGIRIGRHHAEILHLFGNEVDKNTAGFYTSYGRFVDRNTAAKIALGCGQITKLSYWKDKLDSSDIF